MTEVVQKRLELMTEELEEMRRTKLFTIQETMIIFKKRKQLEHKIHALTKDLKSYHDYINYEKCLLKDVALRRRKFKIAEKRNSIDQRIIKRIKSLYDTALQRFGDDLSLFLGFLKFCKKVNYVNAASDAVAHMIKTHSDKPEVWKIAANWHMYDRKDIKTSLVMLLKGLELHKDSRILYMEVLLNEVYNVEHNKADENTSVKRIMGVVDTIFNNIQSPDFYVEILELLSDHDYTMDIQNYIIQTMMAKHFDNENLWHSLGQREFQSAQPETKLNNCIAKYKEGLFKVTPSTKPKLWVLYLDFLIHLHENTDFGVSTILKMALRDASEDKSLLERFYIVWLDLVSDELDLAIQILEKGTSEFPYSVELWNLLLHHSILKNDSEKVSQVFKLGVKRLKDKSLPLWQTVIQYYRNEDSVSEIYEDGVAQPKEISDVLKPQYIYWLATKKGTEVARQVYARLSVNRPYCYSLHKVMSEIESKEESKNLKAWEKVHEIACSQFGKEDIDVWISRIHFYLHHYVEQSQRVHLLYKQAQQNLPKTLVVDFLSSYSQIMDE
ncbi:hypothetical protein PPYR_12418 [Photinus pyralis]|uniref:U3 small nucleolar RNA-associated protein 6 homolog n=1 Tax=Photinus pyralis TaxID=7054 RepID=A0A1Y1MTR7_PHOPY|nr:U3 small nucleolar RNA-associated protein 6 homolog [Photinus pyralis]KAB0795579.1 hypothetical protein PPYR_12418 [Photinus pyralis]